MSTAAAPALGVGIDCFGVFSETRPTCGEVHVPAAYNPWIDMTWCLCGDHQWHGPQPTLHTRHIYDHVGRGARLLGYDIYWLEHPWPTT